MDQSINQTMATTSEPHYRPRLTDMPPEILYMIASLFCQHCLDRQSKKGKAATVDDKIIGSRRDLERLALTCSKMYAIAQSVIHHRVGYEELCLRFADYVATLGRLSRSSHLREQVRQIGPFFLSFEDLSLDGAVEMFRRVFTNVDAVALLLLPHPLKWLYSVFSNGILVRPPAQIFVYLLMALAPNLQSLSIVATDLTSHRAMQFPDYMDLRFELNWKANNSSWYCVSAKRLHQLVVCAARRGMAASLLDGRVHSILASAPRLRCLEFQNLSLDREPAWIRILVPPPGLQIACTQLTTLVLQSCYLADFADFRSLLQQVDNLQRFTFVLERAYENPYYRLLALHRGHISPSLLVSLLARHQPRLRHLVLDFDAVLPPVGMSPINWAIQPTVLAQGFRRLETLGISESCYHQGKLYYFNLPVATGALTPYLPSYLPPGLRELRLISGHVGSVLPQLWALGIEAGRRNQFGELRLVKAMFVVLYHGQANRILCAEPTRRHTGRIHSLFCERRIEFVLEERPWSSDGMFPQWPKYN